MEPDQTNDITYEPKRGREPWILGITGGVGCGKSTVLEFLQQEYGAEVIQADLVARELMEPGQAVFSQVVRHFGEEILTDGRIDRPLLASLVFQDAEKRTLLNQLTHPAVKEEICRRIAESGSPFIVIEAALLLEDGYDRICHEIWYIRAEESVRIRRLMDSRGYTRERCLHMMASQMKEDEFRAACRETVDNSGPWEETRRQLETLLEKHPIKL